MIITGGKYKGRKLQAPDEKITRPTLSKVRQGVFNVLFSELGSFEGKLFLDLFGGSGIMGLEAISRGFETAFVFEKNPKVAQVLKKNYYSLNLVPELSIGDSLKLINKLKQNVDVIYLDPPYKSDIYEQVFNALKSKISAETIVVAEHSELLNIVGYNCFKEKNYGGKLVSFYSLS